MDKIKLIEAIIGCDSSETPPLKNREGDIKIVVLQRGWVFIGNFYQSGQDCWLENANCIRRWGTTKGLGEIALGGPTGETVLEKTGKVSFHELTAVLQIDCEGSKWKNKL